MNSSHLNYTSLLNSDLRSTDLNEEPLDCNFQSSIDHLIDEEAPDEVKYSTPSNKNQSIRKESFTIEEDKLLVSAWLNVGLDPVRGRDQKSSQFWKRILQYFEENKAWPNVRTEKSLINRWNKISKEVSKFVGHYADIERINRSGCTEQDKVAQAKQKFKAEMKHAFVLDHCWVILRYQKKWMDEQSKVGTKRKLNPPSLTTDPINLEDDNTTIPETSNLERPIGRKAAKEVIKKEKIKQQKCEKENTSKSIQLLEELKAKRLESERKRDEQFELLLAVEQKQADLKEKEIELHARTEDAKIMAMDTSVMPPDEAEFFFNLKKEIKAKRAHNSTI